MKNITWLLIHALLIYNIFCNESILSKFHQNGFKMRDMRTELVSYKEKYFHFMQLKTFKYNRTTPAVNGTFKLKISVKDKTEAVVQVNKFLSNEYRHFPIRFQVNARKAMESNAIGLGTIKNCGNLTTFSFEKNVIYHFCNFIIDENRLPPLIPNGMYKTQVTLLYLNEEIAILNIFGEIYTPIEYPKN